MNVCYNLSGKRDSDSRPRPWQGRALPTELFPQYLFFAKPDTTTSPANNQTVLLFLLSGCKYKRFFLV